VSAARPDIARARRLVVKLGTSVLTGGSTTLDDDLLASVARTIAGARAEGRAILLVSSGAIGAGAGVLRLGSRPTDVSDLQAAAAAGQPVLMRRWSEALEREGIHAAQLLVSRADFDSRERFLNFRNCLASLDALGAVAIVNENDTVATEEISLGDNDVLAAKAAIASGAEALIALTSAPGVQRADGTVVDRAETPDELEHLVREEATTLGRGGMRTKILAAQLATRAGVACVIGPGRPADALERILSGEPVGTLVPPADAAPSAKRRWIALTTTPLGAIHLDDGAARAVTQRNASLLARGVTSCDGAFDVGDPVALLDPAGREIARGLTNLSAAELRIVQGRDSGEFESLLGRRSHEEVVHRDNLVLTQAGVPSGGR